MARILINGITFVVPPTEVQVVTIKYRLTSDPDVDGSYTTVSTNTEVPTSGLLDPPVEITGVSEGATYTVKVSNNCSLQTVSIDVPVDEPTTYVWLEATYVCESDDILSEVDTFSGFSSPRWMFYNETDGLVYVVDIDDVGGNVYWFNPDTLDEYADAIHSASIIHTIYSADFDAERNVIYLAGRNTNGLIVFDMETKTISDTVAYGTNSDFNRLVTTLIGDNVYCGSGTNVTIVNANTLTSTTIASGSIPSGSAYITQAYTLHAVGSEVWAAAGGGRSSGNIAIYNASLTTLIATVTLPAIQVPGWGFSNCFGQSIADVDNDRFYHYDTGSNSLYVINTTTRAIVKTITFNNRENKDYSDAVFTIDTNLNKIILSWSAYDTPSDVVSSVRKRVYIIDRTTMEIDRMIPDVSIGEVVFQSGTRFAWGSYRGNVSWSGVSGWDTDGTITKLTY